MEILASYIIPVQVPSMSALIAEVKSQYEGTPYSIATRNCQHFVQSIIEGLTGGLLTSRVQSDVYNSSNIPDAVKANLIHRTQAGKSIVHVYSFDPQYKAPAPPKLCLIM